MRIGHPSGCLSVDVAVSDTGTDPSILKASIGRTARVLLEGIAYLD
jgi:2-methylaconitate cis-trans-isomerase PrpF